MYKNILENIDKVQIYPIFSLVVFVAFFTGLIVYLAKAGKHHFDEVSALPLQQDQEPNI